MTLEPHRGVGLAAALALAGGDQSEYPMVEDATEVVAFGGVVSYNSQMDFEMVARSTRTRCPRPAGR